ncbi:FHA domain-containing protein [Lujinxingia sediminis]|uniref:FHA domain-containing protein n=2 Tax=Lujinxingia sediminis TaxID=2480984 RepID=A0ABY0CVL1_9DELT|nr:FHA domain-containing protein [Lujinxingia sediminis]
MSERLAPEPLLHVRAPGTRTSPSCQSAWHPNRSFMSERLAPEPLLHVRAPGTRTSPSCQSAWHPILFLPTQAPPPTIILELFSDAPPTGPRAQRSFMTRPKSNDCSPRHAVVKRTSSPFDLDVLRGWSEERDPALASPHALSALATLHQRDASNTPIASYPIFGPAILLGRFHSQHSPVDLLLDSLQDHQTYRLGSPHAHLEWLPSGQWGVQALAPQSPTLLNDERIDTLATARELRAGDRITLGVTTFEFEPHDITREHHQHQLDTLLTSCRPPALFLMRSGAPAGPCHPLDPQRSLTLGRSYPPARVLPNSHHWPPRPEHFWDLSGLPDIERKFVAFQHARLFFKEQRWHIEPLSTRQRTYVNRIPINVPTALEPGDELGLGSALFHLQLPTTHVLPRRNITPPRPINWSEGHPPAEDPQR